MAFTRTLLTSGGTTTDATSFTTASVSPSANRLYLLSVMLDPLSGLPTEPVVTGCGLTWVAVGNSGYVSGNRYTVMYRAMGSSPTAGTITIDGGGTITYGSAVWFLTEYNGINTTGTNGSGAIVQTATGRPTSTNSPSVAFTNPPATGNETFAIVGAAVQDAQSAGTGWTQLSFQARGTPAIGAQVEYANPGQQNITASWTTSANSFVVGVELLAATGGSAATAAGSIKLSGTATATVAAPSGRASTPKQVVSTDPIRSGGYSLTYTVDAYRGGVAVSGATGMRPIGGQVVDTMKPGARRTLSLDLAETPGLFDLLAPTGTTLKVTGHLRDIGRRTTDIPMGVFDIDAQSLDVGGGKLSLTAPDLWQKLVRSKFIGPYQSITGLSVAQQIAQIIRNQLGSSTTVTITASSTATMGAQTWDKDAAQAVIDLAASIAAWVYVDRSGNWTVADVPTIGASPKWLLDANPAGVLTELTRQRSRTTTYNVVCVEPQSASDPTFQTVWVWDTDPNSPTYAGPVGTGTSKPNPANAGPFGLSVYYASTALPLDPGEAQVMAYNILAKTVGLGAQVSLSTAINPNIDAGDVCDVLPPKERYDLVRYTERHVAETVTHPLVIDANSATHIDGRSTRTDAYT